MPSNSKLFFSFLRLGLTAFGGPAMVAYIQDMSVKRHQWVDEKTFKDGVAMVQSIPGATAMQIAAYVGLRSRGIGGALLSYVGFGLPAFVLMLILAVFYERSRNISQVISLFNGLQVIVVAIVANALYSFSKGTIKGYKELALSALSTLLFWSGISPFLAIIVAALANEMQSCMSEKLFAPTAPIQRIIILPALIRSGWPSPVCQADSHTSEVCASR
jgi:chromate transporter